jgi:hypothetical protein
MSQNTPLVNYAIKGLERCWLPQLGRWSHIYHLDGRDQPSESVASSDVFYTLNVLLGFARVRRVPDNIDLRGIFQHNVAQLQNLPVPKYALGMALWASAELRLEIPGNVLIAIRTLLSDKENWLAFRAQDLGMILTGAVAQARLNPSSWSQISAELFDFLIERYRCASGLFFDAAIGPRRRFASFATQTYLTFACYAYGIFANNERAIEIANTCTRKLISLQGPNGEWPWFFDVPSGLVADFYEIYSVHQYGMAPAFLECADMHNVKESRDAIVKGFKWVLGENQLKQMMLVPELQLSIRSQVRKGEMHTKKWRALRAFQTALSQHGGSLIDPTRLELRLECRSYELGWILWSFGQRTDLPQLTNHQVFVDALRPVSIAHS